MFQIPKSSNKKNGIDIYKENVQELNNYLKSNPISIPSTKKEVKCMRQFVENDFPILKAALDFQLKIKFFF